MKQGGNDGLFQAEVRDGVAVILLEKDLIGQLVDIEVKEPLFAFLDRVAKDGGIRSVLIRGCPEKPGKDEYLEFFLGLLEPGQNINHVARIHNAVSQLVLKLKSLRKMVVHADCGEINSIFFNVSLACDYRIVAADTLFHYPTLELGLAPMGAGIFFLNSILGEARTKKLLLSGQDLTADQALALGLVDEVADAPELMDKALEKAKEFSVKPLRLVGDMKRLLALGTNDLEAFLNQENKLIMASIQSERFRRRLEEKLK